MELSVFDCKGSVFKITFRYIYIRCDRSKTILLTKESADMRILIVFIGQRMTTSRTELAFRCFIGSITGNIVSAYGKQMNLRIHSCIGNPQGIGIIAIEDDMPCKVCCHFLNLTDDGFHFSGTIKLITEEIGDDKMCRMKVCKLAV